MSTPINELDLAQPETSPSLVFLKNHGFNPSVILDIGAYKGEWATLAHKVWPDAYLMLFEANPQLKDLLPHIQTKCGGEYHCKIYNTLLDHGINSDIPRKFCLMGPGSSLYPENTPLSREFIELKGYSLDVLLKDFLAQSNHKKDWLLKLDVQGAELDVLTGAVNVLRYAEVIQLEVSLLNYNEGGPLFAEVIEFMERIDFAAYDFCGAWRRQTDNVLYQIDMIFVREDSALRGKRNFWLMPEDCI